MAEKFAPAAPDKHAEKPVRKDGRDKKGRDELEEGLEDSFPASDPVSNTQPKKTSKDD
jgi:hypothetical protein